LTQAGSIVGTVDYMSPEQAEDSTTIDHRADIYSLGCTLYFLLTGRAPYQANSMMAVLVKHRDAPIPNLRDLRPDAPLELEALVHCMLAKKPETRIASMTAVIQVLEQLKADLASATSFHVRSLADLTVILVEPSRVQAGIVRKYLQELGVEKVHSAASGKEALELARQHDAQVVVSSMHLADMTGEELAKMIRADAAHMGLGFVLATSEVAGHAALRAIPHTVLMPKPFDAQKLAAALAEATGCSLGNRTAT
jgi:CheY-like chemotaxis protein